MNDLLQAILTNTYTLQALHKKLEFLRQYYSAQFFNQAGLTFDEKDLLWLKSLGEQAEQFNANNLNITLETLDKKVEALDQLTMYFAVDLPQERLDEVVKKVRQNIKPDILVDVKIDPSLLGGCTLVWKGIYKDYSIKKKIEDNKTEVMEQFKNLLK